MKTENPIEEIWRIRDQLGTEENYDGHRLFERLRREQPMIRFFGRQPFVPLLVVSVTRSGTIFGFAPRMP